ncbi:hypothetical protein OURE66S_03263 [Oligella ureolytica]
MTFASRAANFISRHFDGQLAYLGDKAALSAEYQGLAEQIAADFEAREYARAIRTIMAQANKSTKPSPSTTMGNGQRHQRGFCRDQG